MDEGRSWSHYKKLHYYCSPKLDCVCLCVCLCEAMDETNLNEQLEKSNCELTLDSKCRAYSTPLELADVRRTVHQGGAKRELKKCLSCPIKSMKYGNITEETIITEQPVSTPAREMTEVRDMREPVENVTDHQGQCSSHGGERKRSMGESGCFHVAEDSRGSGETVPSSRCYCHVESSWKCVSYCFCYDCFVATLYHCFWEDNTQYQQGDLTHAICSDEGSCSKNMQKGLVLCMCVPCLPCAIGHHLCK